MTQTGALDRLYEGVISKGLCAACGACVGNCPYLVKYKGKTVKLDSCTRSDGRCYEYCPVASFDPEPISKAIFNESYDNDGIGNFTEVKASRSTSVEILKIAQGGGTVTSLMSLALKEGLIDSAVVTSGNVSGGYSGGEVATTVQGIKECAGSKFVGAHSLDALRVALQSDFTKIGIVGLPCQVRSIRKMQLYDLKEQNLKGRIGLVIGLFCNWSFSGREFRSFVTSRIGDKEIKKFDVPPPPANEFIIETEDGAESIPLDELRPLIQDACHQCPDMTSEFADLSVGMYEGRPGWNTLIIRSRAGQELVQTAIQSGVIQTEPFPSDNLAHLRQASRNKKERVSLVTPEARGGLLACQD
ncbi:MAG: Coenzyme F420 hydrogenase/dehydrogenase, beta subunit C-terminal domain [Pseudomonadota bacterium]